MADEIKDPRSPTASALDFLTASTPVTFSIKFFIPIDYSLYAGFGIVNLKI